MRSICYFTLVLSILAACSGSGASVNSNDGEVSSSIAAGGESEAELQASLEEVRKEEEALANEQKNSLTSMTFDKMLHKFGKVKVDTDNKVTFVVTNSGKNPLIIEDVAVSCGCTTAEKPEKPIAPGKSEKISVVFHPKPGQLKEQKKSITVTANTDPKIVVLEIEAFVEE
ncbi:MAG: DUF1573 domain-containing protein [Bacteroidota bacterium]|jgi:hypothetical protein